MDETCEVALPVPLDRTFTYALRGGQRVVRGSRVIAPFRNEKLIGIVVGVGQGSGSARPNPTVAPATQLPGSRPENRQNTKCATSKPCSTKRTASRC